MITLTAEQAKTLAEVTEAHRGQDVHVDRVSESKHLVSYGTLSVRLRGHQTELTLFTDGLLVSPSGYQLDPTNLIYAAEHNHGAGRLEKIA